VVRLTVFLAVLAVVTAAAPGCAPAGVRARLATATSDEGATSVLGRHARIAYAVDGHAFKLPVVKGTIRGQPATMLLDTGASSHIIAGWLARKIGLPTRTLGDVGTDHVGQAIPAFRVDRPEIAIDEWGELGPGPALVTEVPEVIERLGIGAFLSPQRLADLRDEAVVLDLGRGELRGALWAEAHQALAPSGLPLVAAGAWMGAGGARVCEETNSPVHGLAYVIPASVEGQDVSLLVDTGAQHSDLFTSSPAGQRFAPRGTPSRSPRYTAAGKISVKRLAGAHVRAGQLEITADVDLVEGAPDAPCPRDGALAMDLLRTCTLLLGRARLDGRCAPPPARDPRGPAATSRP